MKGFLFDENIPIRFLFSPTLPTIHSKDLGESLSDSLLWEFARKNELVIVTKDTDFSNRSMFSGTSTLGYSLANWKHAETRLPPFSCTYLEPD